MAFAELIRRMTAAACEGDGAGVAACFAPDGVYHDVFYGAFKGADIARMIEEFFHRDARDFVWDIHDPVDNGAIGYARYVFSFTSKLVGHEGRRACFEGVAICRLEDGLITQYHEVAEATAGLALMGFPDERIAKHAHRMGRFLMARDEAKGHHGRTVGFG